MSDGDLRLFIRVILGILVGIPLVIWLRIREALRGEGK